MHCYDCQREGTVASAVAVCRRCGAGLCAGHTREGPETVHEAAGTGRHTHSPGARRLTCSVCHEAEV